VVAVADAVVNAVAAVAVAAVDAGKISR